MAIVKIPYNDKKIAKYREWETLKSALDMAILGWKASGVRGLPVVKRDDNSTGSESEIFDGPIDPYAIVGFALSFDNDGVVISPEPPSADLANCNGVCIITAERRAGMSNDIRVIKLEVV